MTAKAITSILPSLSMEESLEITRIYSVLGLLREDHPLITEDLFEMFIIQRQRRRLWAAGIRPCREKSVLPTAVSYFWTS